MGVPAATQIYTPSGWRRITEVKKGDYVFTLNVETNKPELQEIDEVIQRDSEPMIRLVNHMVDFVATKDHMLSMWRHNSPSKYEPHSVGELAEAIEARDTNYGHLSLRRCFPSKSPEDFEKKAIEFATYMSVKNTTAKRNHVGVAYSVQTPNKTWLMRQNGVSFWTL